MYTISDQLYVEVAERLWGAIGTRDYFSGSVTFTSEDVECKLLCTLFISRGRDSESEGRLGEICKITPVWWEFHTTIGSEELLNDFSFKTMLSIAL